MWLIDFMWKQCTSNASKEKKTAQEKWEKLFFSRMCFMLIHITGQQCDLIKVECILGSFLNDRSKKQTSIGHWTMVNEHEQQQHKWRNERTTTTGCMQRGKEKHYSNCKAFTKIWITIGKFLTSLYFAAHTNWLNDNWKWSAVAYEHDFY